MLATVGPKLTTLWLWDKHLIHCVTHALEMITICSRNQKNNFINLSRLRLIYLLHVLWLTHFLVYHVIVMQVSHVALSSMGTGWGIINCTPEHLPWVEREFLLQIQCEVILTWDISISSLFRQTELQDGWRNRYGFAAEETTRWTKTRGLTSWTGFLTSSSKNVNPVPPGMTSYGKLQNSFPSRLHCQYEWTRSLIEIKVSIISHWICIRNSLSNHNSTILMNLYQTTYPECSSNQTRHSLEQMRRLSVLHHIQQYWWIKYFLKWSTK